MWTQIFINKSYSPHRSTLSKSPLSDEWWELQSNLLDFKLRVDCLVQISLIWIAGCPGGVCNMGNPPCMLPTWSWPSGWDNHLRYSRGSLLKFSLPMSQCMEGDRPASYWHISSWLRSCCLCRCLWTPPHQSSWYHESSDISHQYNLCGHEMYCSWTSKLCSDCHSILGNVRRLHPILLRTSSSTTSPCRL